MSQHRPFPSRYHGGSRPNGSSVQSHAGQENGRAFPYVVVAENASGRIFRFFASEDDAADLRDTMRKTKQDYLGNPITGLALVEVSNPLRAGDEVFVLGEDGARFRIQELQDRQNGVVVAMVQPVGGDGGDSSMCSEALNKCYRNDDELRELYSAELR